MKSYSLTHVVDHVLMRDLGFLARRDRATTAELLAHVGEVDERKLYLPEAFPSMYQYCVGALRMSEDTAFRRISVARAARRFPAIFPAIEDGRLNLTSVLLLAPHLAPDTAEELLAAAGHKTKEEIRLLLAARFPRPDMPTAVQDGPTAPAQEGLAVLPVGDPTSQLALERVGSAVQPNALISMEPTAAHGRPTPLSPGRFGVQFTMDQETHDVLLYVRALLGHAVAAGDIPEVFKRSLKALAEKLERQKLAKCARSRPGKRSENARHVPATVRRAVWMRDGGQCTFTSDKGKRCEARSRLEFDHMDAVARGGHATEGRMRLRCRAHNQFTAEQTFGAEFMRGKREQARGRAEHAKAERQAKAESSAKAQRDAAATSTSHEDVIPWLRQLGFSLAEARRGAAGCADIPDSPLEQRVRVALRGLAPGSARRVAHVAGWAS